MSLPKEQQMLTDYVRENWRTNENIYNLQIGLKNIVSREKVLRHLLKLDEELVTLEEAVEPSKMFFPYREYIRGNLDDILYMRYYLRASIKPLYDNKISAESALEWIMRLFDGTWLRPMVHEMIDSGMFPELKVFYQYGFEIFEEKYEDWLAQEWIYNYEKLGGPEDELHETIHKCLLYNYKTPLDMLEGEGVW